MAPVSAPEASPLSCRRRARPMLGTLVEVGLLLPQPTLAAGQRAQPAADEVAPERAFEAAFAAMAEVQSALSRFDPASDLSRWHALSAGGSLPLRTGIRRVLAAALALAQASDGAFDISLGTGPQAWRCKGGRWWRDTDAVRLDMGGIAKGHAVDCAVRALRATGWTSGWVNAGGDLRAFGETAVPVLLRDEGQGSVRPWASLTDGAVATSHFAPGSRSALAGAQRDTVRHVSVIAPRCLWADALTKVVAVTGDAAHPLLARLHAQAFLH